MMVLVSKKSKRLGEAMDLAGAHCIQPLIALCACCVLVVAQYSNLTPGKIYFFSTLSPELKAADLRVEAAQY
jgi:hypothetical protein